MPVTQMVLQQKALMVRDAMLQTTPNEDEKGRLQQFRASKAWVCNFIKRFALRSVSLSGEAGSASEVKVAADMSALRERLRNYNLDCIFNVDETGFFFKLLPQRTYLAVNDSRKSVRGTKDMIAKDCVTAYVCTNADGSAKLPMAIIGTAKSPRCFRLGSPPVPYLSQRNAWSDSTTFRIWFLDIFHPFIRRFTSRTCVLLMENCGPHGTDLADVRRQVQLMTLPPNCTSLHQPMDMGIIAAWKARYGGLLPQKIVKEIGTRQQRREGCTAKREMCGLCNGFDPHMLDVAHMVRESWNGVSVTTIARCWRKAQVLLAHFVAEVNASEEKMSCSVARKELVKEMVSAMKELSLCDLDDDDLGSQLDDCPEEGEVERWIKIEEDDETREALVQGIRGLGDLGDLGVI